MQWYPTAVLIDRSALDQIVREAATSAGGHETGGILLGADPAALPPGTSPSQGVWLRHAGGPGPAAVRQAEYFRRDYAHAQQLALNAFDADGSQWVGEWHTHPRGGRRPSPADRVIYRRHLADPALGFARFTALIVTPRLGLRDGVVGGHWHDPRIAAWTITSRWTTHAPLLLGTARAEQPQPTSFGRRR